MSGSLIGGLTCRMTPMACLWVSNRAGEGAAGSSASVDMLSRTVPITRVLYRGQRSHGAVGDKKPQKKVMWSLLEDGANIRLRN